MKSWITDSGGMLGVNDMQCIQAKKFSKGWYNTKRREISALWEQRQDVHKGCVVPMSELRAQVAEAVKARRMRKAKTRTNQKYLKMSRNSLRIFWSRSEDTSLEHPLQGLQSIQRNATKKSQIASRTRLLKTWPDSTGNAPRNAKKKGSARKTRRTQRRKESHTSTGSGIQIRKLIDLEWS
jgi:hypothetical protein